MNTTTTKTATAGRTCADCGYSESQHGIPKLHLPCKGFQADAPPEHDAGLRESEQEHTPTPWQAANNWIMRRHPTCDVRVAVCDAYTAPKQPSDPRDRANAMHIVRCVNSHESLVDALQQVNTWLVAPAVDKETVSEMQKIVVDALRQAREGE